MKKLIIILLSTIVLIAGCNIGNNGGPNQYGTSESPNNVNRLSDQGNVNMLNTKVDKQNFKQLTVVVNGEQVGNVPTLKQKNETFVPITEVLQLLDYKVISEGNLIQAGITDIFIKINTDSNNVEVDEQKKELGSPILEQNNKAYLSTEDLNKILGAETTIDVRGKQLNITIEEDNEDFGFPEGETLDDLAALLEREQSEDIPVVTSATATNIINLAKRYMGVPYVFGSPAGYTRTFDCSSFTQWVYYKNGIRLPRVARSQAKLGVYVPVSKLQRGDLLFFHFPGRNVRIGHVGIYAGNGYMIHSSPVPKDGVQVENLKSPNSKFRPVYLGAKRVRG